MPLHCGPQRYRVDAPADDMGTYYKLNLTIPALDQLLSEQVTAALL